MTDEPKVAVVEEMLEELNKFPDVDGEESVPPKMPPLDAVAGVDTEPNKLPPDEGLVTVLRDPLAIVVVVVVSEESTVLFAGGDV